MWTFLFSRPWLPAMPRVVAEIQAELDEVREAISAVLRGGQINAINNRALTRASLRDLREMREDLERELARAERGGIRVRRGVPLG